MPLEEVPASTSCGLDPNSIDFGLPTDPVLFWNLDLDGVFSGNVTLTFGYDDASFVPFHSEATLVVFHFVAPFGGCTPGLNCGWIPLSVVSRDLAANTITVVTNSLSPFALGGPAEAIPVFPYTGP